MIKIENVEIYGWEAAIRGMRNPKNSWDKSDSKFYYDEDPDAGCSHRCEHCKSFGKFDCSYIGKNDLKLMKTLAGAGNDHGKFMRMITVTLDITAPLYWWKEFDTYKVGTVADSCSTMHKIHEKEFTIDDFSWDKLLNINCDLFEVERDNGLFRETVQPIGLLMKFIIPALNVCRENFLLTKNKDYWWQMIQLLPSSYNQKRTVQLNYAVLKNMYHARKEHKLDEWRKFCKWIETLPYSELIIH